MTLSFSHRKATQALNFFARQAGGQINKMKALKLVFFTDRYHLRQFGRPVTNDDYFAMGYGPVPSGCRDLAEMSDFLDLNERAYAERFLAPAEPHCFRSQAELEREVFSASDFEALAFAWHNFGRFDEFELCGPEPWRRRSRGRSASPSALGRSTTLSTVA